MRTGKMKCSSAPEQREKRNKTVSSCCSSNFVARPTTTVFNQSIKSLGVASTFVPFPSTMDDLQACYNILFRLNKLPYRILRSAQLALKDGSEAIYFLKMSESDRLKWLRKKTPLKRRPKFDRWLNKNYNVEAPLQ